MTINSVYIKSFGKLRDKDYILNDGFNVIFGKNESGKSTFLSFIRFMFYGAKKQRGKEISFRDKYTPWSGENMEGELVYTHKGTQYSLSRSISASGRKSEVKLINKSTGEEIHLTTDEVGTEIFGMSEQTFLRTLFISSEGTKIDSDGEILAKISNVSQSGEETSSYQAIAQQLKERAANLDSRRGSAVIPYLENEIASLLEKKQKLITARDEKSTAAQRLENAKAQLDDALKEQALLSDAMEKLKRYRDFSAYKKAEEKLNNAAEDVEKAKGDLSSVQGVDNEFLKNISPEDEEIILADTSSQSVADQTEQVLLKNKAASSKTTGFIFAALTAVSAVISPFIHIALLTLAAVFGILSAFSFISSKKAKDKADALTEKMRFAQDTKKQVLSKYGLESTEHYRLIKRTAADTSAKAELLKSNADAAQKRYDECKEEFDSISAGITAKYGSLDGFEAEPVSANEEELTKRIKDAEQKILNLTRDNVKIKIEADSVDGLTEEINQADCVVADLKERLDDARSNLRIINLAKEILDESYEEIKSNFAPRLAAATQRIFNALTGGKYGEVTVNDKFEIQIRHEGKYENSNYFSSGTIQQLYFSLRLGIIELLAENFPLFIDDAFITYDDERFNQGEQFLKEYSLNNQIVFTTCHQREKGMSGASLTEF